jgi:hypothetical protein
MFDTYLEAEYHEDDQYTSCKTCALVCGRGEADEADDEKDDEDGGETDEVDWATAKFGHDPPCDEAANQAQAVLTDGEVERIVLAEANTLHELSSKTHKWDTT